jgi:LDH2 family malate/lactate/ureidoglycolate dehydrogenase
MERNMIIDHVRLLALANGIVTAGGSSPAEAVIVAEHLVEANLCGHDSHGVGRSMQGLVTLLSAAFSRPRFLFLPHNGRFFVVSGALGKQSAGD